MTPHSINTTRSNQQQIKAMFSEIARDYDFLNKLISLGLDNRWRKIAMNKLGTSPGDIILDLGSGSGDMVFDLKDRFPNTMIIGADITLEMLQIAKEKLSDDQIHWVVADAVSLPFKRQSFDAVVSAFLLRNTPDVLHSLKEQFVVLKDNGNISILDTTKPQKNLYFPFVWIYLKIFIPLLGFLFSTSSNAYRYLSESTIGYLTTDQLSHFMQKANFSGIKYCKKSLGIIAIHWATK